MALPILRTPEWTDWEVSHDSFYLDVGTREHEGKGYVIIANSRNSAEEVNFEVSGLGYQPLELRDYFTKEKIADIKEGKFVLSISPYQSGVYYLDSGLSGLEIKSWGVWGSIKSFFSELFIK